MTASRDPDQLIRAWLAEGPTELPHRSFEAVDARTERTRQRAIRPWRNPHMSNLARLGVGAAAVIVAAVIGITVFRSGGSGPGVLPAPTPSASPSPAASTPTVSPSAVAYAWPARLAAGTYSTSLSWDPSLLFTFTVPDGWLARDINIVKNDRMTVKFFPVADVVTDVCQRTLPATPAATTPEAVTTALGKLVELTAGPRAATIGNRDATTADYLVTLPTACSPTDYTLFKIPAQVCGTGCGDIVGSPWLGLEFASGPEHNRVWLMQVGRRVIAVDAAWTDAATAADLAELQAVIDSIRLDTPLATPPPQAQPAASGG